VFFVDEKHVLHVPELNFSCSYKFDTFIVCSEDTYFSFTWDTDVVMVTGLMGLDE